MQSRRMMSLLAPLAPLVAVLATSSFAGAAEDAKTVKVTGMAAIRQGDQAMAKDQAIADAHRKAIEQVVGTMVTSETVTENYQLISDKIYSKAKGYVRTYEVLSSKVEDGMVVVEIQAQVSTGNLQNDLQGIMSVLKAKNLPRVLVMVSEQNVGGTSVAWWQGEGAYSIDLGAAENAIIDALMTKGVPLVDRQALQGKITSKKGLTAAPNDTDVKEFAVGTGAEVVITGTAIATDQGNIMGTQMRSLRANISLKALSLDSGQILATVTETAAVGHIDTATGGTKALDVTARKATQELLEKILNRWESEVAGPATVQLKIANVAKSKFLRVLKTFLGNDIRGVQNVRQRSYSEKTAEFEVEIKGSAQALAEELEAKDFGDFGIEINEITANTVTASLTGKR